MQTHFAHVHDQTRFGGDALGVGPEVRGGDWEELLQRKNRNPVSRRVWEPRD